MINIRKATMDDCDRIYEINVQDFKYEYPYEVTKSNLEKVLNKDDHVVFVAEDEGKIIGYIEARDHIAIYAPELKDVMALVVSEEARHKGVGKKLMDTVIEWAKKDGAQGVRLTTREDRVIAHKFYEDYGFEMSKIQKNFKMMF